jgi:L-alanine-DL-glutamate epimerase-like enolase superfamily enzyme
MDSPFQDATMLYPWDHVENQSWVYLYDKSGVVGESPGNGIEKILPLVLTGKKEKFRDIFHRVFWLNRNFGFAVGPLGALDTAFNDILSKKAGLPMHRYLGATRDWVHVYASGHRTNAPIRDLVAEAESFKTRGYRVYKMKIGTDFGTRIEEDVERVKAMREVIGPEAKLALDANQLWTADEAMNFFRKVEKYDIYWFEEPVHSQDLVELEKICAACPVPISMGESLHNGHFFKAYLDAGIGQVQANPPMMGFADWSTLRDLTYSRGLMFSGGGVTSTAFLATAREDCYEEYLQPRRLPVLRCMKVRPEERDGKFFLPPEPGLSVKLDLALLRRKQLLESINCYYPE